MAQGAYYGKQDEAVESVNGHSHGYLSAEVEPGSNDKNEVKELHKSAQEIVKQHGGKIHDTDPVRNGGVTMHVSGPKEMHSQLKKLTGDYEHIASSHDVDSPVKEQVVEYAGQPANIPFDADKPKKLNVVIGKKGEGSARASQLAKNGLKSQMDLKKFLKKETLMGKAGCTSEEADLEESRGHKILATKLRQIDTMSSGIAPDLNVNPQSTRDKLKDDDSINKAQIVTQKDTTIKGQDNTEDEMETKRKLNKMSHGYGNVAHNEEVEIHENLNENHNFGSNVDTHIKSLGHGKIGFVMDQQKDNLIAVHHQDGGKHHLSIFHKGNLVNQSTHDNFENASGHAHSALTTKKGMKSLNLREETELQETEVLNQYIKSLGYDPQNTDKNKKDMFSKTNAFKTWASTREGVSIGQDNDAGNSLNPNATARG